MSLKPLKLPVPAAMAPLLLFTAMGIFMAYRAGDAQTQPPPLKIRPNAPTNEQGADFTPPENAYDGPATAAVGSFIRHCRTYCTGTNTKQTEWWGFPPGYRPERLLVRWAANAVMGGLATGDTAKVIATIESKVGDGNWTLMEKFESTTSANTQFHDVDAMLAPTIDTSTVRVRATFFLEVICNWNCTGFSHAGGAASVADIWIEARPALTITQNPVVRGDTVTISVAGAPGGSVAGWSYETENPAVGTITRSTNTASTTWPGKLVAGGTVRANVTVQNTVYPLELEVEVQPRPGWAFSAPLPQRSGNGYFNGCVTLTANSPVPGLGGDGKFHACIKWDLTISDIEEITDQGPNHGLKWVLDIRDQTTADWVMHPDVDNPNSDWYVHQCGNWVPVNSSCTNPSGTGFISGADYASGVARHEAGPTNSHYADFKWAYELGGNNIKVAAEKQVGSDSQTKEQFLIAVNNALTTKRSAIDLAYRSLPQPCSQTCDASCTTSMGFANTKLTGNWYVDPCPF